MKFQILRKNWLILVILVIASFLRLYKISEYMTFLGDEGRDVLVVKHLLEGDLVGLGPTASVGGFFLGPIYYYFMVPFLWLWRFDPTGPAVMVALFGIATTALTYKVASEFFGKWAGVIASVLYASSPLVIAYSRSSWNPNLMPFFSLLSILVLYRAVEKKSKILLGLVGVLLGITMQLHYLATFLAVIIFVYILVTRILLASSIQEYSLQKTRVVVGTIKDYFYVIVGFLTGFSPFLAFEATHGFPNLKTIIRFVFYSEETGIGDNYFGVIGNVFFRLFARFITTFPPPEQVSIGTQQNIAVWYYATLILALSSTVLLFAQWFKNSRTSNAFQKIALVALWLTLGVGLFGFYKKPIYDYYFGFMFPLPFLLVGNLYSFLLQQGRLLRVVAVVSAIVLLLINLREIPFRSPSNRQLDQVKKISRFVLDKTGRRPFNFALVTGGNSDHAYRYFFELWDNSPITIENFEKDPQRKTVTNQLLVVCESIPCGPLGHPLWEIAGYGRAEIVGEWDVSVVKIYKLIHYREK